MKIPQEYVKKIGTPQKLFRTLIVDGVEVLIRLQKPFEEKPDDDDMAGFIMDSEGVMRELSEVEGDAWMEYGTCIIVEAWSEASQSIVTQGIRKSETQSDEEFAFGARYMLNNGTEEEWLDVIKKRKLDRVLKLACNNKSAKYIEPTVKQMKKKK